MRIRCSSSIMCLLIGASLSLVTTSCKKKVAAAPPPPPPVTTPIPPPPRAPTASLNAEPATVEAGQSVTLTWSTTDASEATIFGLGSVGVEGKQDVQPVKSTTYELVAKGPGGSARASTTITVVVAPPPTVAPQPVETKSLLARLEEDVSDAYFDYDRSDIREDARTTLAKDGEALRSILNDFPGAVIIVEGHCDERGSAEYNLALGDRRGASARAFLEALGVEADRLRTISYGKERPQCTDSTEACWQKNRRVHFSAEGPATN
jgi:peptidoglycan-associated lipoprotein